MKKNRRYHFYSINSVKETGSPVHTPDVSCIMKKDTQVIQM